MAQTGFVRENCCGATAAPHYRSWQHSLVRPHLGPRVLEIGSGMGYFSETLVDSDAERVVLSDFDAECLERLRAKYAGSSRVDVREVGLPGTVDIVEQVDAVVAMNVLEHIEDHVGALQDLAKVVVPGGRIIIWVPAHMALYGEFDKLVGHVRRYNKKGLTGAVRDAGLNIVSVRHVNFLGGLAWWAAVRIGKAGYPKSRLVWLYDGILVPFSRFVERFVPPPFGQTLLCVAEVPA